VIGGIINCEQISHSVPMKSGSGTSGMSFSFLPLTVMTRNFSAEASLGVGEKPVSQIGSQIADKCGHLLPFQAAPDLLSH
jgi:hypothetical protein